jgi:hypothetical protein
MDVKWHPTLSDSDAAAWDAACNDLDLHPFQYRSIASARTHIFGQGLGYLVGKSGDDVVFGAATHLRRNWPLPPRLAVTRGPWARDAVTLATGLRQLVEHWPAGLVRPMVLQIDPHLPLPASIFSASIGEIGFKTASVIEFLNQTMIIPLLASETALWASFKQATRQMIRKSDAIGLRSSFGDRADVGRYLALHQRAVLKKGYGTPSLDWLLALFDTGQVVLVLTEADGQLIAGAFVLRGARTLYYMHGATAPEHIGPATYQAFWYLMRWAIDVGITHFDLGAITDDHPGLALFKRRWGGQACHYTNEQEWVLSPARHRAWLVARRLLRRG